MDDLSDVCQSLSCGWLDVYRSLLLLSVVQFSLGLVVSALCSFFPFECCIVLKSIPASTASLFSYSYFT